MLGRAKGIKIIIIFILLLGYLPLEAAWWEMKGLPVPPHTKQTKEENQKLSHGGAYDTLHYQSELEAAQIMQFYRQQLGKQGWQEKDPLADFSQKTGVAVQPNLEKMVDHTLILRKDNQVLVIKFIPSRGKEAAAKSEYILARHKMGSTPPPAVTDLSFLSKLPKARQPKKEFAPAYPQAVPIQFLEKDNAIAATYYSYDQVAPIIAFYKNTMPTYGWRLDQAMAPAGEEKLVFSNARQDTCVVAVYRQPADKEKNLNLGYTLIVIAYAEKK